MIGSIIMDKQKSNIKINAKYNTAHTRDPQINQIKRKAPDVVKMDTSTCCNHQH